MEHLNEIKLKADYCLKCKIKPCTKGCPLGNNIPDFIDCVKLGNYKGAFDVLHKTTVLESICGRICPHEKQCQGKCVRGINGEAVSIGNLEAFVGDMAIEKEFIINEYENSIRIKNGKKIAIVGSGPAGLTCAAFLARNGYSVTIYEKNEKLGGLLRYGIPEFRLDRNILDKQIKAVLNLGIEAICGKELGKDFLLGDLKKEYDAVFLAFGANISKKMNVPGEDLEGVFGGNELLEKNLHPNYNGKKVAVIGGGNVAMDVARTVKRLGADTVYVIYRRAEEQMPAEKNEIQEAKNEEIVFMFQNNIVRIMDSKKNESNTKIEDITKGTVTSIECIKTDLVKREQSDRLVPVNILGSNFILDIDYVILAVGSKVESKIVSELGVNTNKWGYIEVDENYMTSIPNVFAGGDLIGTEGTVAYAARDGRDAAKAISRII